MKTSKLYSISALFAPIILAGCYSDFEPDLESTPVVCVNSLITAGEKINAEVTRTWRYSEGNPGTNGPDIYLQDSDVSLFVNNKFECKMVAKSDTIKVYMPLGSPTIKYFASDYVAREGDRIKICVKNSKYGDAEAEVVVPYSVGIDDADAAVSNHVVQDDRENDIYTSDYELTMNVKFTDPEDDTNYFTFSMGATNFYKYSDETQENLSVYPDYSIEPLFSEHISPLEIIVSDGVGDYTVFSDRQISGKQYSLRIPANGSYNWDNSHHTGNGHRAEFIVELSHISPGYYNYMLSLWATTEGVNGALSDVGLSDPVWEFSNVSTGAGIVAARAVSTRRINAFGLLTQ